METRKVRAKVIMLPTENKQDNIPLHLGVDGKLRCNYSNRYANVLVEKAQHLYFTMDEKIKENDWQINTLTNTVSIRKDWLHHGNIGRTRKIIVTTDKSLGLPEPSQAFIQKYCELGGIDEVDIEYKIITVPPPCYEEFEPEIKVDSTHNTVIIHSIKDSWSREELTDILQVYRLDYEQYKRSCHYRPNQKEIVDWSNKWIKENL